ncbi:hypothetical protein [Bailinhaonella thermotolerans]|uniref:hypothetical protein n=1 Tax=Bailinhaonella thermotolerans TaxID=1070861 RepID=UPI0011C39D52|nr:hypothetical protein [Bailinhaonella thermotolerans]
MGPIPDGQEIDHLCHDPDVCEPGGACPHRRCGNPRHLQAVSRPINNLRSGSPTAINARKTHCWRGHPLWGANLYRPPSRPQQRDCETCRRIRRFKNIAARIENAGGYGRQLTMFVELGE